MTQPLSEEAQSSPFVRKIKISEIENDLQKTIEPTEGEREAIRVLLELEALDGLVFSYRLREGRQGRVHLSGRLKANAIQTCVVSLEPLSTAIDIPVEVDFWPRAQVESLVQAADDPDRAAEIEWPEVIEADAIDLGSLIYETLATALDLYPKKVGAKLQWKNGKSAAEMEGNRPFAVLKHLKKS